MGIEQYNQSVVQLQYLIENNLITPEDAAIMQEKLNETKIQLDATKKTLDASKLELDNNGVIFA